ncbi:MAG TPA: LacI family DNA-binding transcriptional regulator [Anaerolineales bacterium]|nr:LacI family DNA-binding transcriptional regulator [Anaerolineales bacterium]
MTGHTSRQGASKGRATIRDVAARAGVSRQTVSRVINAEGYVAPETREQVELAIAELGFRPNVNARSMALGRSQLIACIAPNLTDFTFASIIDAAEIEARTQGYGVVSASAETRADFVDLLDRLVAQRRVDGVLVINPLDGRESELAADTRALLIGARSLDGSRAAITLDEEAAGRLAIRHLLSLGHRVIGMIQGPTDEDCVQVRSFGALAELNEAGIVLPADGLVTGDWSATSGYTGALALLERIPGLTAIFAQNDRMAIGALHALREAGRRVPDDVSIIGFDDIPLASYFDPALSTIQQDFAVMGRRAAHRLIAAFDTGRLEPTLERIPATLIVRQSTRAL